MANMTLVKTPMPEQDPQVRARNFKEVALGYTAEMAIEEAGRCLHCKNPKCVEGCPVNTLGVLALEAATGFLNGHFGSIAQSNLLEVAGTDLRILLRHRGLGQRHISHYSFLLLT